MNQVVLNPHLHFARELDDPLDLQVALPTIGLAHLSEERLDAVGAEPAREDVKVGVPCGAALEDVEEAAEQGVQVVEGLVRQPAHLALRLGRGRGRAVGVAVRETACTIVQLYSYT